MAKFKSTKEEKLETSSHDQEVVARLWKLYEAFYKAEYHKLQGFSERDHPCGGLFRSLWEDCPQKDELRAWKP